MLTGQSNPSSLGDSIKSAIQAEVDVAEEAIIQDDLAPYKPDGIKSGHERLLRDMFKVDESYGDDQEPMASQLKLIATHLYGEQGLDDPSSNKTIAAVLQLVRDAKVNSEVPESVIAQIAKHIVKQKSLLKSLGRNEFYGNTGIY